MISSTFFDTLFCVLVILGGVFCFILGYFFGWVFGSCKREEEPKKCETYEEIVRREG